MNLLLLTDRRYPSDHPFLETIYGKLLPQRGHSVYWIMRGEKGKRKRAIRRWHRSVVLIAPSFGPENLFMKTIQNAFILWMIFRIMQKRRIDIIQTRNWVWGGMVAILSGKQNVFQYSFPSHILWAKKAADAGYIKKIRIRFYLFRWGLVMRYARVVFVISRMMERQLADMGFPTGKYRAFGLGFDTSAAVDPQRVESIRRAYHLEGKKVLVYFGAMDPERRMEFLIDILDLVRRYTPAIHLFMIGGTDHYISELHRYSKQKGLENHVTFMGKIPRDRVYDFVASADLTLSPVPPGPLYEVSSVTKVYESLGLGIPAVVNDLPDQGDLVSRSGGGRSVHYDANAFTSAIVELLSDQSELNRMGEAAREYIRIHHSYQKMAGDIEHTYLAMK